MSTIILVPAIMGIAIVSVVAVRAVYHAFNKDGSKTWDVEEFTKNLNK